MTPKLAAIVIPQRIPDQQLVESIPIHVKWIWKVSSLPLSMPQDLQIAIEDPEALVAILYQNVVPLLITGDIEERDTVTIFELVWRARSTCSRLFGRHPGPAFQLAGSAFEDLQLEIANRDYFVLAIAIDVVNLQWQVIR